MVHQELVGEDGRYLDASLLCLIQVISAIPSITIDPQITDQKPKNCPQSLPMLAYL